MEKLFYPSGCVQKALKARIEVENIAATVGSATINVEHDKPYYNATTKARANISKNERDIPTLHLLKKTVM